MGRRSLFSCVDCQFQQGFGADCQLARDSTIGVYPIPHWSSLNAVLRGNFHFVLQQDEAMNAVLLDKLAVRLAITRCDHDRYSSFSRCFCRERRQVSSHLRAISALRVEEYEQRIVLAKFRKRVSDTSEIR